MAEGDGQHAAQLAQQRQQQMAGRFDDALVNAVAQALSGTRQQAEQLLTILPNLPQIAQSNQFGSANSRIVQMVSSTLQYKAPIGLLS